MPRARAGTRRPAPHPRVSEASDGVPRACCPGHATSATVGLGSSLRRQTKSVLADRPSWSEFRYGKRLNIRFQEILGVLWPHADHPSGFTVVHWRSMLCCAVISRAWNNRRGVPSCTAMSIWSAIARFLTVCAVIGLVGGAALPPAKAGPATGAAVTTTMADGMVCCDPPASGSDDCRGMKACPFPVLCAAKCPQGAASAELVQVRPAISATIPVLDDQPSGDLASPPLGHPPKA